MGLSQHALTEVLVVPRRLPWPLVHGVFDYCFGFFEDIFCPDTVRVLMTIVYGSELDHGLPTEKFLDHQKLGFFSSID